MADENIFVNGVQSEVYQPSENSFGSDESEKEAKVSEMSRIIEALENEKQQLVEENGEIKDRVKKLMVEIEGLKEEEVSLKGRLREMERDIELTEDGKRALEAIAARAVELETEVSRLQHDLISAMSEGEESNAEIAKLNRLLGDKGDKVQSLEREVEELKKANVESEIRVRELEGQVRILEQSGIEEKDSRIQIEEQMRGKFEEKEKEIDYFRKKVEDLESVIVNKGLEIEKWIKEKLSAEESLTERDEKERGIELQKEVEEAEKVISGLKEKAVEAVNGTVNGGRGGRLESQWPKVAGSIGLIFAVAAVGCFIMKSK